MLSYACLLPLPLSCLQAVHLAQASFQIEAFGSMFILDLSLNK